ncbi:MAG TPA: adenylate/guanylate cyclase domain-containing protein [Acidimicrobiales bacterium]|nr:adenylate/guanylate cyclase domain-containing protein [Acidimicrobiales bacterium]
MTASLPSGTVTFLMSDVEASSELWRREGRGMDRQLDRLDVAVKGATEEFRGAVIKARGEGDSHFSVFHTATDAVLASVQLQRELAPDPWPKVRIGLHVGAAEPRDGDYVGPMVNRTARIRAAAHGGQILCTRVVVELYDGPEEIQMKSLGSFRVRDAPEPIELVQVVASGLVQEFPPVASLDTALSPVMAVMFVDQVGSAARAQRSEAPLAGWQGTLFRAIRGTVAAHAGVSLRLTGDGGMAAFHDPRAAIACARELCSREDLRLRGSVAAGVVELVEGELSGRAVFEAGAHSRTGEVGEVWISGVARALVEGEML